MSTPNLSEILKSPDMVRTINEILSSEILSFREQIIFINHTAKIHNASISNEWLIINITTSQGPMHVPINLTQNNKSYIRSYIKFGEFNNSDNSLEIVLETPNDSKTEIDIIFKSEDIKKYLEKSEKFSNKNDLENFVGLVVKLISSLKTILNYAITRKFGYLRVQPQSRVLSSQIYEPDPFDVFNLSTFKAPFLQKYLKYKQKYLELKKNLEK
jgi:hypothetical protein